MRTRRLLPVLVLGLVALTRTPARAQGLPVIDAANLIQNSFQVAQSVLMVVNMGLELTGLDGITIADGTSDDLTQLLAIASEARQLGYDLSSLQSQIVVLFDLSTAPDTPEALRQRLSDIRQVVWQARVYSLRTQTLMQTTERTVAHFLTLAGSITDFVGNMQAQQTIAQMQAKLAQTTATMQVQTSAFQRAQTLDAMSDPLAEEAMQRIYERDMADWPGRSPR